MKIETATAREATAQKYRMCDMRAVLEAQTSQVAKAKPASAAPAARYVQGAGCKAATP